MNCDYCGDFFVARRLSALYCSDACRQAYRRARLRAEKAITTDRIETDKALPWWQRFRGFRFGGHRSRESESRGRMMTALEHRQAYLRIRQRVAAELAARDTKSR